MINIRFRECCEACPNIDVNYDSMVNVLGEPATIIGCSHMCVCGRYSKEEESEESPPEIKGFCDA